MKLPISLVVITKNEELNIERCIKSVPFVDDILVLDSHSTDKTKEIAINCGARFFSEDWRGYGKQKQRATELAKNDWVINLDADEALSKNLCQEIEQKFSTLDPQACYEIPRRSQYLGRWIRFGGWYPDRQRRLYNRQHSFWSEDQVHEKVQSKKVLRLENDILHFVFRNIAHHINTNNRYSSLQAEVLFDEKKRFSFYKLIIKAKFKFIETYILKLGFLDGMPGLIISVGAAYSVFLKWAKVWEFEKLDERDQFKRQDG